MPLRSTAAAITRAARSSGRIPASAPPYRPMGVRTASMIRASAIARAMLPAVAGLAVRGIAGHAHGRLGAAALVLRPRRAVEAGRRVCLDLVERLRLEQGRGERFELLLVLPQHADGAVVALLDDSAHLE